MEEPEKIEEEDPQLPPPKKREDPLPWEAALNAGFKDVLSSCGKYTGTGKDLARAFTMGKCQLPRSEKFTLFGKMGHKGNWLVKIASDNLKVVAGARSFGDVLYLNERKR